MDQLINFDPTVEKLQGIIAETSKITAEDLSDDAQLAVVRGTRLQLRDARVVIEKQGKAMRADALKFQKDVIAHEKMLIDIIDPEERRLKSIEEEATAMKERAARAALLPMRREMLSKFPAEAALTDDAVLDLDNDAFMSLLNGCQARKNEADRIEIEKEKARLADEARMEQVRKDAELAERTRLEDKAKLDEERRIQAEAQKKHDADVAAQKLIGDAKAEAARVEEEARLEREAKAAAAQKFIDDAKAEAERIAREAREEEAKRQAQEEARLREIAAREQQEKDEITLREADAKYQEWLAWIGYSAEDDVLWIFKKEKGVTAAFKFVQSFAH